MRIAPCNRAQAPEILAIFNEAILHSTAIYEYEPRSEAFMATWFEAKERAHLPVVGAFTSDGDLAGFASYGPFRPAFPAYRHTVEHSVYVHPNHRRRGVARALLAELIAQARTQEVRVLLGVIDAENAPSLALHDTFGFTRAGTLRGVGYKFGRWLDVELLQLTLAHENRSHQAD